jgi:hypothetical protein
VKVSAARLTAEVIAASRHLLMAGGLLIATLVVALWLFMRLSPVWDWASQPGGWVGVALLVALSAMVRELLRVISWLVVGRVRWSAVSFILTRRGLGLTAILRAPIPVTAFRIAAIVPTLVLGLVPLGIAFATHSGLVALWGAFLLFEGLADCALLAAIRRLPATAQVTSHPTELGCVVGEIGEER